MKDAELADAVTAYLDHLKAQGRLAGYRLTRRKLDLGHPSLPEWNILMEFDDLAQLDTAFKSVSGRAGPVEAFHHAVNSKVDEVMFALHRDFPDPQRKRGEEKF